MTHHADSHPHRRSGFGERPARLPAYIPVYALGQEGGAKASHGGSQEKTLPLTGSDVCDRERESGRKGYKPLPSEMPVYVSRSWPGSPATNAAGVV